MKYSFLLIFIFISITSFCQKEFENIIESISKSSPKSNSGFIETKDSTFIQYAINNIIPKKEIIYVSDRRTIPKIEMISCDTNLILFRGELKEMTITIELISKKFDKKNKVIEKYSEEPYKSYDYIKFIDGQIPFGAAYSLPNYEITELNIFFNDKKIYIPKAAFSNFYDVNFCENYGFMRNVEAYNSIDEKYIYIYLYGGNAAGTYFAKLIFDKNGFITKWVADYGPLSNFGSFHKGFLGF